MIKQQLYEACLTAINQRIHTAQSAMEAAQAAANEESKSSVGDKYETGRAMMQQERDKNAQQLAEAVHTRQVLRQINWQADYSYGQPGSLVITSQGHFFISISMGKIVLDGVTYFAISPATPIGRLLQGKTVGDTATFNGRKYEVQKVC